MDFLCLAGISDLSELLFNSRRPNGCSWHMQILFPGQRSPRVDLALLEWDLGEMEEMTREMVKFCKHLTVRG